MNRPRVLITRTRRQASLLSEQLQQIGVETILIPTIEVVAPGSFDSLDAAIASLAHQPCGFDWLILTSANAVQALAERALQRGAPLHPIRVAAIGPATARACIEAKIAPQSGDLLLPPRYVAESLAEALLQQAAGSSQQYLLVRAEEARDVIPAMLEAAGHRVAIAAAYRNVTPPDTLSALRRTFGAMSEWPSVITFTSSSTARNLVELLESIGQAIPREIALASIGPITSATLRELGYEPTFEAAEPTIEALTAAIAKHLGLTR